MCTARPEEVRGISFLYRAPVVAMVVLGDNISEIAEMIDRCGIMLATDRFGYSQQSDERM